MIWLSPDHLCQIEGLANAAAPLECCGLLAGRVAQDGTATVTRIVACDNISPQGQDRFEVDPQARFDLMRALRNTDEEIIGHFHSHPTAGPEPSETDIAQAYEPEFFWLITGLIPHVETRAWRLNADLGSVQSIDLCPLQD